MRICPKCKVNEVNSCSGKCRECLDADYLPHRIHKENMKKQKTRTKERTYQRKYNNRSHVKLKRNAKNRVLTALSNGSWVKQPCSVCGSEDVLIYHPDPKNYRRVWWLCKEHLIQITNKGK